MPPNDNDQQPNVLMITCHDMGRYLGCYDRPVQTPAINRLAGEGVRFDRYFCTAPQCSPSRAAMTTGRFAHANGVMGLPGYGGFAMADSEQTLAKTFADAGWSTYLWGFQHEHTDPAALGYQHDPLQAGFEVHKHVAKAVTPPLCDWLKQNPGRPFFASVGFFETHIPFAQNPASPTELNRIDPLAHLPDSQALRQDLSNLAASVHQVDHWLWQIMDALKQSGLDQNTIVILTTDHGIPFARAKCSLYEMGMEAALIMRWPAKLQANRVVSEMLSNVDLMPTLLDLCGIEPPEVDQDHAMHGRSFAGLLEGGPYHPREEIFAEMTWHDEYAPMRCIRTHRHKLIHYFEPRIPWNVLPKDFWNCCAGARQLKPLLDQPPPQYELFDLAVDPFEQRDLLHTRGSGDADAIRYALDDRLEAWRQRTNDPLLNGPVEPPKPIQRR